MPSFHYIALNQEQKELSGVIEAPDEPSARGKLNELGISVVSLNMMTSTEMQKSADKEVFEFEAFDKNKKKVIGTIVAENIVKAYERLFGEYQLTILSLVPSSLPEKEKQEAKVAGISKIQKQYDVLFGTKEKKADTTEVDQFAQERIALFKKVDFTMARVEEFLQVFGPDLKMEERDVIRAYINQLIRIRDSTNLEHIRSTCERMLNHLQTQEIFLNEEKKQKESAQLHVETKELLRHLKSGTGLQKEISIVKFFESLRNNKFFKPVAEYILKLLPTQNPEIKRLEGEIEIVMGQLWSYAKLMVMGKTPVMRNEALNSIKTLWQERKRLKLEIHALRSKEKAGKPKVNTSALWEDAAHTIGWVLAFYLFSYMISYPFTIKHFPLVATLPRGFYFYHSGAIKFITVFLFIAYITAIVRNFWFKNKVIAPYVLLPFSFFAFLLIVINLM